MFVPSTDVALGLGGIVAVLISSMELLNLFLVITPVSVLLDCIKLAVVARPKGFGLLVFIEVCLMAVKIGATYFAYTLKKSQEDSALTMGGVMGGAYQPYQPYQPPSGGGAPAPLSGGSQPFDPNSQPGI